MAKVLAKVAKTSKPRGSAPGERRGGRTKGTLNKATLDVRSIARGYAPAVIERLGWLASNAESESSQIAASKEILDRAYGKSPQPMDGDGEGGDIKFAVRWLVGGK